jgi:glutathione S-transferase
MSLTLYYHPFASFCQKVLIALYENNIDFEPHFVDLGDPKSRAEFLAVWPIGRFPVLADSARGQMVPESTIIIEYLTQHFPSATIRLVPTDPDLALITRQWDRFYDHYVEVPMQKIVTDCLRPPSRNDTHGVEEARGTLKTSYTIIEREMAKREWANGADFSMADCAAAPALFYASIVEPFRDTHPNLTAYFERLMLRPSFVRVVEEASPYMKYFPYKGPET